jgi:hypothetical protein
MDGFQVALVFGLIILLLAVMYLANKIQKLHRHARHLRHLVQRLEGAEEAEEESGKKLLDDDMGGAD